MVSCKLNGSTLEFCSAYNHGFMGAEAELLLSESLNDFTFNRVFVFLTLNDHQELCASKGSKSSHNINFILPIMSLKILPVLHGKRLQLRCTRLKPGFDLKLEFLWGNFFDSWELFHESLTFG